MATKTDYSDKLQDPRWQKKRLEILERDGWKCRLCGDKDSTLHVHHKSYRTGKEPWEYENSNLVTYCKYCHALIEAAKGSKLAPLKSVIKWISQDCVTFFAVRQDYSVTVYRCSISTRKIENILTVDEEPFAAMIEFYQKCISKR